MNWYRKIASKIKIASVTFSPSGSYKMSQPMDMLGIASDMLQFGHYQSDLLKDTGVMMNDITPDGDYHFQPTGVMNFYIPIFKTVDNPKYDQEQGWTDDNEMYIRQAIPENLQMTEQRIRQFVDGYNQHKMGDVVAQFDRMDISNMSGKAVARINVVENKTTEIEPIPEVQMANGNYFEVAKLLKKHGVPIEPEEYGGQFTVDEYIGARQLMQDSEIEKHTRPEYQEGNMYDAGLPFEQIEDYFTRLDQMAAWIQKSQLPDQTIAFG